VSKFVDQALKVAILSAMAICLLGSIALQIARLCGWA
jgi:hypothetical protein